jgi:hypothetical protein
MDWKPIESVNHHKPVWLRALGVGPVLMQWSFGRSQWTGMLFGVVGPIRIWWDESVVKPTEWAAAE